MKTRSKCVVAFPASMQLTCRYFRSIVNVKKIKFQADNLWGAILGVK